MPLGELNRWNPATKPTMLGQPSFKSFQDGFTLRTGKRGNSPYRECADLISDGIGPIVDVIDDPWRIELPPV